MKVTRRNHLTAMGSALLAATSLPTAAAQIRAHDKSVYRVGRRKED